MYKPKVEWHLYGGSKMGFEQRVDFNLYLIHEMYFSFISCMPENSIIFITCNLRGTAIY